MARRTFAVVTGLFLLTLTLSEARPSPGQEAKDMPDVTNLKLEDHGIPPVKPTKDPKTGFVVGGKNATALLRQLTEINGRTIADLEKDMRPGASSTAGFLGKDEKLLDVLAADNEYVVEKLGLTHQELARHLHAMGAAYWAVSKKGGPLVKGGHEFLYHGRKYRVVLIATAGFQPSPFNDGTKSGVNARVENLNTGKKLGYGMLVPFMIERYGFYEGKGTSYRVEPKDVVELFDFLKQR